MNVLRRSSVLALVWVALASLPVDARAQEPSPDDLASPKLRIEWAEFKPLYDAKNVVVIDVRGRDSFKAGHIPGARSVPLEEVEKRAGELKKLSKPIVAYCT